jgi:hypothetical protein
MSPVVSIFPPEGLMTEGQSSTKAMPLLGAAICVLAFTAGTLQGCGGSSAESRLSLCEKICDKVATCSSAAADPSCKAACKGTSDGGATVCTNEGAILTKMKECSDKSCADLDACRATIPACTTGGASDGSAGAGGSDGSAGAGDGAAGTSGTDGGATANSG